MPFGTLEIEIKDREVFANLEIRVQVKRDWRVRIGLLFIRMGCYLSGAQFVDEFPMSLIQDDEPVDLNKDR